MESPMTRLGRYELVKRLGSGGMGDVHLARLRGPFGFEKLMVVKRIRAELAGDAHYVRMFLTEARLAAKLSHPNLVQVYDLGRADDGYFLAMEFVDGVGLEDLVGRARDASILLPASELVGAFSKLAAALAYAHDATDHDGPLGLVHRDVTPRNILLGFDGEPRLIDFGIAKSRVQRELTAAGVVKGRVAYMSPEQTFAGPLDRRTDVFSLAVCLYEACTLRHPFLRRGSIDTVEAIRHHQPPAPSSLRPCLRALDPVLARAMAKEPAARHPGCAELGYDLLAVMDRGALPPAEPRLTELLHGLFATEIRSQHALLEQLRRPTAPAAPANDDEVTVPDARPGRSPRRRDPGARAPRPMTTRSARALPIGLLLGVMTLLLLTLLGSAALMAGDQMAARPASLVVGPSLSQPLARP